MAKIKATFYLPVKDNEGRSLASEIKEVQRRCFARFDAWTRFSRVKGSWRMASGVEKIEESDAYIVVLEEEDLEVLTSILQDFKEQAGQEAIYLEVSRHLDIRFL